MQENFGRVIGHVLLWEGGSAIRPNEPGGAVNKGVSYSAFKEWREQQGKPHPTVTDLLALTDDEAKEIYRKNYADKIYFDTLPAGMDAVQLHGAVMFGVSGVKKMAEKAKGDWAYLVVLFCANKMHREIGVFKHMAGWSDRFVAIYELAASLR